MITITIQVPETMTASVRGQPIERDVSALPQAAWDKILEYGFQRINNDAGAISRKDYETDEAFRVQGTLDAIAAADKKWDALVSGTIRVSSGRTSDPVMQHAMKLVTDQLVSAAKKAGLKDAKAADFKAEAKKRIAAKPEILAKAKRLLDEMSAFNDEIEVDVDGLGEGSDDE